MEFRVWDRKRKQWIPEDCVAITANGRILIVYDIYNHVLGATINTGWKENPDVKAEDCDIFIRQLREGNG